MAPRVGVNWRTIARYENDQTLRISYETLAAIAKATGKSVTYFVGKVAA